MPWLEVDDYFKQTSNSPSPSVDTCEKCESTNLVFIKRVRYVSQTDQNPVLKRCLGCGHITTFWD